MFMRQCRDMRSLVSHSICVVLVQSQTIGLSRWTITLVGVPPSDIRVLPKQQAMDKNKAKKEEFMRLLKVHENKEDADIIKN
jgi:hypothetical protein